MEQFIALAPGVRFDVAGRRILREGHVFDLTPMEFALLDVLCHHANRVVPTAVLIGSLWSDKPTRADTTNVYALIRTLRRKVEPPGGQPVVLTRRGHGYMLVTSDEQQDTGS